MTATILLMAAGASSRMGARDKLLEDINGLPLIADRARMCFASGAAAVRVVLSPDHPKRRAALAGLPVEIVETKGAHLGLSHSLQTGADGVAGDIMIVLADLVDLTPADLDAVLEAAAEDPSADILRGATPDGRPGHPVLLRARVATRLAELRGDMGLQTGFGGDTGRIQLVQLAGDRALADLDTPEDWARWRAGAGRPTA